MSYTAGKFGTKGDPDFASELASFLNQPEVVEALMRASDHGRPAIEAIRDPLLGAFPEAFVAPNPKADRNKQTAGALVRQVLERNDYELVAKNERVDRFPFTRGASYRRVGAFEFHVFRSNSQTGLVCVSTKRTLSSLPEGSWSFWTTVDSKLQLVIALGIQDADAFISKVKAEGHLTIEVARILRGA